MIERPRAGTWSTDSQQALRDTEARFRELADNISQFAWTADRSGWIYWYNKRWHDYTGTTLEEMEGWGWQKVHHPDHVERVVQRIRRSVDTGTPWEDTFPLRGRDGTYRWFLSRAQPIRDDAGDIVRWFGTNTDITAQIDAEKALRELSERLEQRVEVGTQERLRAAENRLREARRELTQVARRTTLAAMTATIAHEISQPLSAIATNADAGLMWLDGPAPDLDEVRSALKQIVEVSHRASDILASIRAMSRRDVREPAPLNVNDLVRDVLVLAQSELESHHIAVHRNLVDGLPAIMGQRVPLQQVLLNLITNAVDAMGALTDRAPRLEVRTLLGDSNAVLITVADCGVGIAPEQMARIFQAFFTTKAHGMGMGLSICRLIVEAHGGRLWATPGTPHGAVFHVRLPTGA